MAPQLIAAEPLLNVRRVPKKGLRRTKLRKVSRSWNELRSAVASPHQEKPLLTLFGGYWIRIPSTDPNYFGVFVVFFGPSRRMPV
jgi:hypothetical protein